MLVNQGASPRPAAVAVGLAGRVLADRDAPRGTREGGTAVPADHDLRTTASDEKHSMRPKTH